MRTIDADIRTELESGQLIPFAILDMNINDIHYRYTNCEIPLVVNGVRYEPRDFSLADVTYSKGYIVDSVDIKIIHLDTGFYRGTDTIDTETHLPFTTEDGLDVFEVEDAGNLSSMDYTVTGLTSVFVGSTPQGSDALLALVVLDKDDLTIVGDTYFTLFNGHIGPWALAEDMLNISIVSILDQWAQRTLSHHPPSCRWRVFGGTECGYVGSEDRCDRSYTRCSELSNTANFGGFRWLPSIIDKIIWWGRTDTDGGIPSYPWNPGADLSHNSSAGLWAHMYG